MKKQEMYMEDVNNISIKLVEFTQRLLKPYKTRLNNKEQIDLIENKLFEDIFKNLEIFCDNDYRQHN